MVNSMLLHPKDDVITAMEEVYTGEVLTYIDEGGERSISAAEDIPVFHKASLKDIKKGASIYKYGEVIGYAICDIRKGEHVHTHNLSDLKKEGGQ